MKVKINTLSIIVNWQSTSNFRLARRKVKVKYKYRLGSLKMTRCEITPNPKKIYKPDKRGKSTTTWIFNFTERD